MTQHILSRDLAAATALDPAVADEGLLRASALPQAPLVMPKQTLEHAPGHWVQLLRRLPFGTTARTGI